MWLANCLSFVILNCKLCIACPRKSGPPNSVLLVNLITHSFVTHGLCCGSYFLILVHFIMTLSINYISAFLYINKKKSHRLFKSNSQSRLMEDTHNETVVPDFRTLTISKFLQIQKQRHLGDGLLEATVSELKIHLLANTKELKTQDARVLSNCKLDNLSWAVPIEYILLLWFTSLWHFQQITFWIFYSFFFFHFDQASTLKVCVDHRKHSISFT